jgi:hypothetical protein
MNLDTLVSQVEAKFPAVVYKDGKGSRAQAAAELVRNQQVQYVGEQGGRDWWSVNGHMCSIKGGCDCNDSAPMDPNGRKLCKHRLAVMFVRKMQEDHGIAAILRQVQGDRVVLNVQVLYADGGRQFTLNGYRADGVDAALEYADRLRFTADEFAAALRLCGWGMTERPVKLAGMNYRYILRRGAEIAYTAESMSAEDVDLRAQRERIGEIAALDAATNDNPIMQGLPVDVQAAILNHAGLSK